MAHVFNEDIFVIDCWLDTKEKEDTLKNLINRVKVFNVPIILCGHYAVKPEIQKMVDYFIYDGNNDILLEKDFKEYEVVSDRWSIMSDYKVFNKVDFHHDYAIWLTMKNAFNLANQLGKKYIHFLEYDNLPDEIQYRQSFMEYVRGNDAVVYEYSENSTKEKDPYSSTYIFSIRTNVALDLINKINSKEEYFKNRPHGWQLEKVFFQTLKSITNNIFVSKYIPNEEELNIFAAWNRNGITRNGARFQTYLALDDSNRLHIHFISGFSEKPADKDYLVEVNYNGNNFFYKINKNAYHLENLGDYQMDKKVSVFYQGIEVFSQTLLDSPSEFRRKNKLEWKRKESNRKFNINFIDGPFVEILDDVDLQYNVQFINRKNNKVEYSTVMKSNTWSKCSIKYYVDWMIVIKGIDNEYEGKYLLDLKENRVMVSFESKSLGDNLAFIPYVEEFRKKHNCKVVCSTFHNDLFKKGYPDIEFVNPGENVPNILALYRLGVFYDGDRNIDYSKHPTNPIKEPLLKIPSDILGLSYKEIKPILPKLGKKKKKMVTIAIHSTAQAKYWNNPTGWQDVVDFLVDKGYEVRLLSREEDGYMGNLNPKKIKQQPSSTTKELIKTIQESEFFIGISSGLSWLAWGSGVPVVLISGFTDIYLEPFTDINRIINKDVCNSCWHTHEFDPGDWNWCPINKGTDRQFECSKAISSSSVIDKLKNLFF
jgi:autotransporter strand-loop-strand O-heptosyltransferase